MFWRTVIRAINPPIDPVAVAAISATLPDDPAQIEAWVMEHIAYDANDYEGWGVIEYFASPIEVLQRGMGRCYARAVVLASLLAEKGIPFRIYAIVGHVWVEYDARQNRRTIEEPQPAQFRWEKGQWYYQWLGSLEKAAWATGAVTKLYWDFIPWPVKLGLLIMLAAAVTLRWQFWRLTKPKAGKGDVERLSEQKQSPRASGRCRRGPVRRSSRT